MPRKPLLPDNVTSFTDRHGKERFRYRKAGRPVHYFKDHPGTKKHPSAEYLALSAGKVTPAPRAVPGTIDDLLVRYYASTGFNNGGADFKRVGRGILEAFRAQHGSKRVAKVTFEHIEAILLAKSVKRLDPETNRMVGGKVAAQSLKKHLRRVFELAEKVKMIPVGSNPVELAEGVKAPKGGIHPWSEAEIAQYQRRHPVGTRARLALEIMLWTGQRRGDAHRFGRSHVKGGKVAYTQRKTGKTLWLPAAPQLLEAIAAMPVTGTEVFVVTKFGKPYTREGFGNKMREWCDQAGLPQCSAHGLRKAIARRAAELEAGNQGIKAIGGWSGDSEVAIYTAAAEQEALADKTLGRVIAWDLANREETDLANPTSEGRQPVEVGRQ